MEPEREVKLFDLTREFNRQHIRHLIVGRRAVILYGGPVLTADHDIWIHPVDKKKALSILLEKFGFELSHLPDTKKPIVTGFSGMKKYDLESPPLMISFVLRRLENPTLRMNRTLNIF